MPWRDRIRTVEVEPSLYSADFSILGEQVGSLLEAGCRIFHFDIGDGHFVEPVTMGPMVLQSISPLIHERGGAIDVHLMVENPASSFASVVEAGGDSVTFHYEAVDDVAATLCAARDRGLEGGVAFGPGSGPEEVAAVSGGADVVCISIRAGCSEQAFREESFDRVRRLRAALPPSTPIQVDGGVGPDNIAQLRDCGATLLVAASAIFARADVAGAYRALVSRLA
ncbi:MAG: ribulose-phosphate 3-epimerase [Gaiellaceae bacterium]